MKRYDMVYNPETRITELLEREGGPWVKYKDAEQYASEEYQTGVNNGLDMIDGAG